MYFKVSKSNNDPRNIANYYLESVKKFECIPKLIRADYGSENSLVSGIHSALSDDQASSFIYGKSISNQRIESFWSQLRKKMTEFWIQYFKTMIRDGEFDPHLKYHIDCIRYSFMDLIQKELNKNLLEWNLHCIRK